MKYFCLLVSGLFLLSGCSRIYFHRDSSAEAETNPQYEQSYWHSDWVAGLVEGSDPIALKDACAPNGEWKNIYTDKSFLNGLVGVVTWGIYTPMDAQVECTNSLSSD